MKVFVYRSYVLKYGFVLQVQFIVYERNLVWNMKGFDGNFYYLDIEMRGCKIFFKICVFFISFIFVKGNYFQIIFLFILLQGELYISVDKMRV